jgi:hypothetical protein
MKALLGGGWIEDGFCGNTLNFNGFIEKTS